MNTQEISKNLMNLRLQHSWTQDDLASQLNISRQAISKWETGAAIPNIDILLALSKMYNISINDIVEPQKCSSITDFEEIQTIGADKIRDALTNIEKRQIVIASIN